MPKPKPDQVVRHEIVLGRSERELVDTAVTAYTVNRVLTPLTTMLGSTAGLSLVLTLVLGYLEKFLPDSWPEYTDQGLADWFEIENVALGTFGAGLGAYFGGPLGGIAGAVVGSTTQEFAESAQEAGVPKVMSYGTFAQIVGGARLIKGMINELQSE